ncbi:MAG: hypothetical protein P1P72_00585, partial [ANME-2 cluster archaeon]|nr:hypothetical protein [ANME-2 cluster archaeon]
YIPDPSASADRFALPSGFCGYWDIVMMGVLETFVFRVTFIILINIFYKKIRIGYYAPKI